MSGESDTKNFISQGLIFVGRSFADHPLLTLGIAALAVFIGLHFAKSYYLNQNDNATKPAIQINSEGDNNVNNGNNDGTIKQDNH